MRAWPLHSLYARLALYAAAEIGLSLTATDLIAHEQAKHTCVMLLG